LARIALRNVRALGRHGADPGERDREQPFDIDLVVELDTRVAELSDELSDTLDYAALHRRLVTIVASTSFALLERLARALIDGVFEDERVRYAQLTIAKPAILAGATPSVTLERRR
jgi:7,8-dihydroneopterin aldolase/epimerase/oxygenase